MASNIGTSSSSIGSQTDASQKICGNILQKHQIRRKRFVPFATRSYVAYSGGATNLRDHVSSKHPLQYVLPEKLATGSKTESLSERSTEMEN